MSKYGETPFWKLFENPGLENLFQSFCPAKPLEKSHCWNPGILISGILNCWNPWKFGIPKFELSKDEREKSEFLALCMKRSIRPAGRKIGS